MLSFEEALTVLSCRPTWTLDEATAWTGSDEDLLINLAMPVAVGWARVQGTGLRARAQPAPTGAIRDVWADGELVEIWGRTTDWWLCRAGERWGWSASRYLQAVADVLLSHY